jgi:pilus assembly protein Flp/PilA
MTMKFFSKLIRNEEGATAIEYGLIAALIAVAAIAAMSSLGGELSGTFQDVSDKLGDRATAGGGEGEGEGEGEGA